MNRDENICYILFMLDSKIKQHDGLVFRSYSRAREYAADAIGENYCDKAVIGMFQFDPSREEMLISNVETIGFKGDKTAVNQLALFKG